MADGSQCGLFGECIYDPGRDHSTCQCNSGYVGDGFECEQFLHDIDASECTRNNQCARGQNCALVSEGPKLAYKCVTPEIGEGLVEDIEATTAEAKPDLCSSAADCHEFADCIYDSMELRYVCQCSRFYEGDGYLSCTPGPDAGCDITNDCDRNAECVYDSKSRKHKCSCNDGYQGDGKYCEKVIIGCNILHNCAKYATCEFNDMEGGYRCKCDASRGFDGDGFQCKSVETCNLNPLVCDPNANCQKIQGTFGCQCRPGFLGDGHSCEPVPIYDGNYIISSQGMALMKLSLDTRKTGTPIYVKSFMTAAGIDVDCFKGKLYWTDTTGHAIMRANYNGTNVEIFLNEDLMYPEGIAVDWLSRNVYWADSGKRTIEVANIDSQGRKVIIDEQIKNPRGIAVDPGTGRLFWTDWEREYPRIESANLDGTERRIFVDTMIGLPNALSMDFANYQLCWTDAGSAKSAMRPEIAPKIGMQNTS